VITFVFGDPGQNWKVSFQESSGVLVQVFGGGCTCRGCLIIVEWEGG